MEPEVIMGVEWKLTFIRCPQVGARFITLNFINSDTNEEPLPGTELQMQPVGSDKPKAKMLSFK